MAILIKGMEMPRDCGECRFGYDGKCFVVSPIHRFFVGDTFECPLIEIPQHGRLIDADEAIGEIVNGEYIAMVDKYGNNWMMPGKAIEIIANAPTIIEAEE